MNKYTIFCTAEQTKKALELGAPIEKVGISQRDTSLPVYYTDDPKENWECDAYYCPTTEQMIGWLEEQGINIAICICADGTYYNFYHKGLMKYYKTRKEATLDAIDAALEYLADNNLIK